MEQEIISKLIEKKYVQASLNGDAAALKEAFLEGAVMNGFFGERFLSMPAAAYAEAIGQGPSMAESGVDYSADIIEISLVSDKIATAAIREKNFNGTDFLTSFQLVKHPEAGWKIVSKAFTAM